MIFDCYNYYKEKKIKLEVIEFTDYAIILWDQLITNGRRNHERLIEAWGNDFARRWEVVSDSDEMSKLEDVSDGEGMPLVHKLRWMIWSNRENIFHTSCYINNKVCSIIIDKGFVSM